MTGLAQYVDTDAGTQTNTQWERVTPLTGPWVRDAFATIERLSGLQAGWDGYRSPRVSNAAVMGAMRVLDFIASWPLAPHIAPVPNGGLQIEWSARDRALEIEILPDGSAAFLAVLPDREREEPMVVSQTSIRSLLMWFFSQQ
jgi:hypothetical protein